jgi:hypothetical protein
LAYQIIVVLGGLNMSEVLNLSSTSFNELTHNEILEVSGGDVYDFFMTVAHDAFVASVGTLGAAGGATVGTVLTGGNPVGTVAGGIAGGYYAGKYADKAWDAMF